MAAELILGFQSPASTKLLNDKWAGTIGARAVSVSVTMASLGAGLYRFTIAKLWGNDAWIMMPSGVMVHDTAATLGTIDYQVGTATPDVTYYYAIVCELPWLEDQYQQPVYKAVLLSAVDETTQTVLAIFKSVWSSSIVAPVLEPLTPVQPFNPVWPRPARTPIESVDGGKGVVQRKSLDLGGVQADKATDTAVTASFFLPYGAKRRLLHKAGFTEPMALDIGILLATDTFPPSSPAPYTIPFAIVLTRYGMSGTGSAATVTRFHQVNYQFTVAVQSNLVQIQTIPMASLFSDDADDFSILDWFVLSIERKGTLSSDTWPGPVWFQTAALTYATNSLGLANDF
jgi:hypothetical protein